MSPSLPRRLRDIRTFFEAFDWERLEAQVAGELQARIAIVGPVNSGKSTLFNLLKGRVVSPVAAVPGTTREPVHEQIGPFALVDTPGFGEVQVADPAAPGGVVDRGGLALRAAEEADLVLLLLDGAAGVRQEDYNLYRRLQAMGQPLLVALNKTDLIKRDVRAVLGDLTYKLEGVSVIPISARTGAGVAERLIPAIIEAFPRLAVTVGRALPAYREQAVSRLIREAAWWCALIGVEPVPGIDVPLLLAAQVRLVLRIAAVYGESMKARHARELLTTIAGGVALRYLGQEAAKLVPVLGWLASGAVAGAGTWAIGRVAAAYFESGRRLSPADLRSMLKALSVDSKWLSRWRRRRASSPLAE